MNLNQSPKGRSIKYPSNKLRLQTPSTNFLKCKFSCCKLITQRVKNKTMQLPSISPEQIKSKADFTKFIINAKRTSEDWEKFGASIGSYLYELLDDESKNPKDDEELQAVFEQLTSPIVFTIGVAGYMETDEKIAWELCLFQTILATENRHTEVSVFDSFTKGLMEFYTSKWPRLKDI